MLMFEDRTGSPVSGVSNVVLTADVVVVVSECAGKYILTDDTFFLFSEYDLLPSKKRFRSPVCKTTRRRHSFIPAYIRLLNNCSD